MQDRIPNDRLTTDLAAPYCGCTPATFKTFRARQKGPAFYRTGKRVIYKQADLDAWMETRRVDPVHQRSD